MVERKVAGALGSLAVAVTVVLGAYGLVNGYAIDASDAAPSVPSFATLGVAVLFVAGLSAIGARAGGRRRTPYW